MQLKKQSTSVLTDWQDGIIHERFTPVKNSRLHMSFCGSQLAPPVWNAWLDNEAQEWWNNFQPDHSVRSECFQTAVLQLTLARQTCLSCQHCWWHAMRYLALHQALVPAWAPPTAILVRLRSIDWTTRSSMLTFLHLRRHSTERHRIGEESTFPKLSDMLAGAEVASKESRKDRRCIVGTRHRHWQTPRAFVSTLLKTPTVELVTSSCRAHHVNSNGKPSGVPINCACDQVCSAVEGNRSAE